MFGGFSRLNHHHLCMEGTVELHLCDGPIRILPLEKNSAIQAGHHSRWRGHPLLEKQVSEADGRFEQLARWSCRSQAVPIIAEVLAVDDLANGRLPRSGILHRLRSMMLRGGKRNAVPLAD